MFLVICLCSCNYFEKKKVNADDILNEELRTFNWNEVDEYPTFTACDSVTSKPERKQCFETTLTTHILNNLSTSKIVVTESVHDTVIMKFQISEKGELTVNEIASSAIIKNQIPKIDSLLYLSVNDLPRIFPAIKRGQQVKTEFKMPIVIQAD